MKTHENISFELLQENKGNYIQLGGKGILDGLKCQPCKMALLRIEGLKLTTKKIDYDNNPQLDDIFDGVYLHWYRHKRKSILPDYNFNQTCRIFTPNEFKTCPVY